MNNEPIRQSPSDIPYLSQKDFTLNDVMRELREVKNDVVDLKAAVTGNGKPMEGLAVRVSLLERWQQSANRRASAHTIGTIINLFLLLVLAWLLFGGPR